MDIPAFTTALQPLEKINLTDPNRQNTSLFREKCIQKQPTSRKTHRSPKPQPYRFKIKA